MLPRPLLLLPRSDEELELAVNDGTSIEATVARRRVCAILSQSIYAPLLVEPNGFEEQGFGYYCCRLEYERLGQRSYGRVLI